MTLADQRRRGVTLAGQRRREDQIKFSNEVHVLNQLSSLGIAMEPEREAKVAGACIVLHNLAML